MDHSIESVKVANTFVERFGEDGTISHMKLQKLCYYAYGWWLALCPNDPPLMQSKPQVWKLGPVFQPVYSAYASHRSSQILANQIKSVGPFRSAETISRSDNYESQIIDWIWGRYGHFTGIQLSDMTHEPGTPWHKKVVEKNFVVPRFTELTDDEIRPYFLALGKKEGFISA